MSNMSDVVGGANLYSGSSYQFTYDRFCNPNQAIYFNQGFLSAPTGVYFSGDFTTISWIQLKSYQSYSSIYTFGYGTANVIVLQMQSNLSSLYANIYQNGNNIIQTSPLIQLNQLYHIAWTLFGTTSSLYVNGSLVQSATSVRPLLLNRTNNQIAYLNLNAVYDELRIYFGAMSPVDVLNDYTASSNNG